MFVIWCNIDHANRLSSNLELVYRIPDINLNVYKCIYFFCLKYFFNAPFKAKLYFPGLKRRRVWTLKWATTPTCRRSAPTSDTMTTCSKSTAPATHPPIALLRLKPRPRSQITPHPCTRIVGHRTRRMQCTRRSLKLPVSPCRRLQVRMGIAPCQVG